MKIFRNIFDTAISLENLLEAWDEFKVDKRKKIDVQIFERNLADNLFALHEDLIKRRYCHGEYFSFYIRDPKIRLIHKATVRDRIVHHAVFRALNPLFEPSFIFDSYSCREQKGTHRAVERLRQFANKVYRRYRYCHVLKCDIRSFFHSIDHATLLWIIARRVKDTDMLLLINILITSFAKPPSERERVKAAPSEISHHSFLPMFT